MKGDIKMAKRSSFGNIVRKRLSDITNSLPHPNNYNNKSHSPLILENDSASANDYIDRLVKEKMALVKHIQEKNKIIELTGIEIQNLRSFLQKMQVQNWSLAKSNTHMVAELNLGKERLKALQHEVACKDALLQAKNFELRKGSETRAMESGCEEDGNSNRRGRPARSRSLGSSTISQQHDGKEAVGCKRRCVRRQSAISRLQHEEPSENLFEIDEAKFAAASVDGGECEAEEAGRRMSMGARPLRKAAVKVQSYKEKPINIKMRRSQ